MSMSAVDAPSRWATIHKSRQPGAHNLDDYDAVRARFTWEWARGLLDGLPGGAGLNIAYEAVDRHARGAHADRVAIRWLGREGARRDITYRELLHVIHQVAPDVDAGTLDPATPFQDQVDIDSVDFMNIMVGIEQALGVDVPERDYPKVASLGGCVSYLAARLAA